MTGRGAGRDRSPDETLRRLAREYGVATSYRDARSREVKVSAETVVAVLAALDVDASGAAAARDALQAGIEERRRRLLAPTVVARSGDRAVACTASAGRGGVDVAVRTSGGDTRSLRRLGPGHGDVVTYRVPDDVPLGYHRLLARAGDRDDESLLIVAPDRLPTPALGDARTWGFLVQLYSVRSAGSWGLGDLHDLAELARWSGAEAGAGMVVVNPLHAAEPVVPTEPSPYLPSSRRFWSPLYLRVDDVPEYAALPAEDRAAIDRLAAPLRSRNHTGDLLDRDACLTAKLSALHRVYRCPRAPARRRAYEAFLAREGQALHDFATWCALAERHGSRWRGWPADLRRPGSPAVARARAALADRVDFHCWLQWLLDEQLAAAQRAASEAGMPVGVVHDLAVGVSPDGADAWLYQDVLAAGATVGAPPDEFNQLGQDWGQPPWRPDRLAATGYVAYRDMIGHAFRHAGGLRIDHVAGLFRLWWVPEGYPASRGTYVRYDHDAMVGVLAVEAHRAKAAAVGEDLGTVEPWVRDYLGERGVFGTSMLWFERERDGAPTPPWRWRRGCLATVATHDLPPIAAYLTGEHVDLRDRLGLLGRPTPDERADAERQVAAWLRLLADLGLVPPGTTVPPGATVGPTRAGGDEQAAEEEKEEEKEEEIAVALHAFLARTPALLIGVSLADAVGERRAQNVPGTVDEYPNWRVPLADGRGRPVALEDLPRSRRLWRVVRAVSSGEASSGEASSGEASSGAAE